MTKYFIREDSIKTLADSVRVKFGANGSMTPNKIIDTMENYDHKDKSEEIILRTISSYSNNKIENVRSYAFYSCSNLKNINLENCKNLGDYAFYQCTKLDTLNLPNCTNIGNSAFEYCSSIASANFPACTNIGERAFSRCSKIAVISLPVCTNIGSCAFNYCSKLTSLHLTGSSLCLLSNSNAFTSTPIASGTGTIYVPASLLTSYQAATNWTYFSSRFSGI